MFTLVSIVQFQTRGTPEEVALVDNLSIRVFKSVYINVDGVAQRVVASSCFTTNLALTPSRCGPAGMMVSRQPGTPKFLPSSRSP